MREEPKQRRRRRFMRDREARKVAFITGEDEPLLVATVPLAPHQQQRMRPVAPLGIARPVCRCACLSVHPFASSRWLRSLPPRNFKGRTKPAGASPTGETLGKSPLLCYAATRNRSSVRPSLSTLIIILINFYARHLQVCGAKFLITQNNDEEK